MALAPTMSVTNANPATSGNGTFNIGSFLTEGQQLPQGSALKATQGQTILPEWYTNYAKQLLANQQAVMMQPFPTPPMPRVAEFSPMQQQGFQQTAQAAQSFQPSLTQATQATQAAMGAPGGMATAQPYFGQAAGMSGLTAAQPYINQAANMSGLTAAQPYYDQAAGMSGLAAAQPMFNQAAAMSGVEAAQPALGQAANLAQQSTAPTGMNAAQPYFNNAAQSTVSGIDQYMNPYVNGVVDRIGQLGVRNLTERIMPEVEGRYIAAGQLGFGGRQPGSGTPSGMMTDTARAVRDVSDDILARQTEALRAGYTEAAGLSANDLARYAQLGSAAGQLGTAQQRALADAAGIQANIGSQLGSLTQNQQQILSNIGSQQGALTQAQQQVLANIGTQTGNLTQGQQQTLSNLGSQVGNLTQGQQQVLANLGSQVGNLTNADLERRLGGAQQLAGMGQMQQQLGLAGAGALGAAGAQQQQLAQRNLDTAYEDFLRQQGWPQQQIDAALRTFQGVAQGVPSASQEVGIVPTNQPAQFQPGTAATIGGALTGAAGLIELLRGR